MWQPSVVSDCHLQQWQPTESNNNWQPGLSSRVSSAAMTVYSAAVVAVMEGDWGGWVRGQRVITRVNYLTAALRHCNMRKTTFPWTSVRRLTVSVWGTTNTFIHLRNIYDDKNKGLLKDISHPQHKFYHVAQSGCRYFSERTHTNRYRDTFLPTSVRLLNAKSGTGKWSGTTFLTILHCHY